MTNTTRQEPSVPRELKLVPAPAMVATHRAAFGHRPRFGRHPRVLLSGATVDVSTKKQLGTWRARAGCSLGLLLDDLVRFARRNNFRPAKKTQ